MCIRDSDEGVPWQHILSPDTVQPTFIHETCLAQDVPERLAMLSSQGFQLDSELPVRVHLLQLDRQSHVLVLALHHSAADGWSMSPLFKDLAIAYAARRRGSLPTFTPLTVQPVDYTLWAHQTLGQASDSTSPMGCLLYTSPSPRD